MRPALVALALLVALLSACHPAPPSVTGIAPTKTEHLEWTPVTQAAAFPPAYNFPVHVTDHGQFVAMHPEGTFASRDGASWTRTSLPISGLNSAYLKYVHHAGATYALGSFDGNYEAFTIDPVIRRTRTYDVWEELGTSDTLPQVVFYAATSFKGALWMLGGYTKNHRETSEVWKSLDGLTWTLLAEQAPWSPRAGASVVQRRRGALATRNRSCHHGHHGRHTDRVRRPPVARRRKPCRNVCIRRARIERWARVDAADRTLVTAWWCSRVGPR